MNRYPLLIILMLAVASCSNQEKETNPHQQADIRKVWDQFITDWENEDVQNVLTAYTEDAVNIPPDYKINRGHPEMSEFYNFLFSNNLSSKYTHEIKSIEFLSNSAIEYGEFNVQWVRNDSTTWTYYGRSMTHWELSENDEWKIKRFLFNNPPEE